MFTGIGYFSDVCDPVTEFQCQNGSCIPIDKQYNILNDCGDNSDESK